MERSKIKRKQYRMPQKTHDEELWLVSYADMMTLLFGFFVILFIFSQVDKHRLSEFGKELSKTFGEAKVTQQKSGADAGVVTESRQLRALQLLVAVLNLGDNVENAISNVERKIADSQNTEAAKQVLLEHFKTQDQKGLDFVKDAGSRDEILEISLPFETLFRPGTDQLTDQAKLRIQKLTPVLNQVKNLVGIEIVGHTDSRPPSSHAKFTDNWSLSSARAGVVAQELLRNGIEKKYLRVGGVADLQPLFPEKNADGSWNQENLAKNRRVHIILKKVKTSEPH